jgi:hypothetical protein
LPGDRCFHEAAAARAAGFDRLASLAPPPEGVTREGSLAGGAAMLDAWEDDIESFW